MDHQGSSVTELLLLHNKYNKVNTVICHYNLMKHLESADILVRGRLLPPYCQLEYKFYFTSCTGE